MVCMPLLPTTRQGDRGPLVVLLHWLGGSGRTWREVALQLNRRGLRTAAIDFPGFGDAAAIPGYSIREMADSAAKTIRTLRSGSPQEPWLLAGHSMGGTVAAVLARESVNGTAGLESLAGVILVSPSPPGPEPMPERKREQLLHDLGHPTADPIAHRKNAEGFLTANLGKLTLPAPVFGRSVDDILRLNPAAFRAWLEYGSREDWRSFIGKVDLPTLVFAGESEASLGPDTQRELTLPHFPAATLIPLTATGHLAPLERPAELAEHILAFATGLNLLVPLPAELDPALDALLHSEHTSNSTRAVLEARLSADDPTYVPQAIAAELFPALRALAEAILPAADFDLAARTDQELAMGPGDGWRPASLPADTVAWNTGLRSLDASAAHHHHGVAFLALDPDRRSALLTLAATGKLDARSVLGHLHLDESGRLFNAGQMKLWFEEARSLLTRLYVADPRTYARIGFTGFADDPSGFTQITLNAPDERLA
jgi:pimeloyl-ACP methyl ester carboxylesterase